MDTVRVYVHSAEPTHARVVSYDDFISTIGAPAKSKPIERAPRIVVQDTHGLLRGAICGEHGGFVVTQPVGLDNVLQQARRFPGEPLLDVVLNCVLRAERAAASTSSPPASRPCPDSVLSHGEQQLWLQCYLDNRRCGWVAVRAAQNATAEVWRLRAIAHGSAPDDDVIQSELDSDEGRKAVRNCARQVWDPKVQPT